MPGFAELLGEEVFVLQGRFCFPSVFHKYAKVTIIRATCPDLMHLRSKSTFQILGFFYTFVQILLPRGCWAFHSGQCFGFSTKKKNALQKKLEPASWNQKLFNSLKFHMQKCYANLWNTKRKGHFRTSVLFPEELGVTCRFHLFCPGPL